MRAPDPRRARAAKAPSPLADQPYSATTQAIRVTVQPVYLEDQSQPADHHYVWAYHVMIENQGAVTVQLRNRHWRITDALGRLKEVRGPGVVGEQPVLHPGQSHDYVSGCPLTTPMGAMQGHYGFRREDGSRFEVAIPHFPLAAPATAG